MSDVRPPGYWDDFANVELELRAFIAEHRVDASMPTIPELEAAGRHDLVAAVLRHGGYRQVAERLDIARRQRSNPPAQPAQEPDQEYVIDRSFERPRSQRGPGGQHRRKRRPS